MTDHQFAFAWGEALACSDRDEFVSEITLSSIWEDAPDAEIPADRVDQLGRIWDVAHCAAKDLVASTGLSQARFAERYCMPRRTVEDWCRGLRNPPDYVRLLLAKDMGLL